MWFASTNGCKYNNKITIYGYTFNPKTFSEFKHYALNYNKCNDSKNKFDDTVREIYSNYKKEVENKKIDNK